MTDVSLLIVFFHSFREIFYRTTSYPCTFAEGIESVAISSLNVFYSVRLVKNNDEYFLFLFVALLTNYPSLKSSKVRDGPPAEEDAQKE